MGAETCPEWLEHRDAVVGIALDDTSCVEPSQVAAARRHLASCPLCHRELDTFRRIVAALRPPPLPDKMVAELAAQLRVSLRRRIAAWQRRRRLLAWAAGLAVAGAVAIAALALWHPTGQAPPAETAMHAARPQDAPAAPAPVPGRPAPSPGPGLDGDRAITPEQQQWLAAAARLRETGERLVRQRRYGDAEGPLRQAVAQMDRLLSASPRGAAARAAWYEKYRCHGLLGEYLEGEDSLRRYVGDIRTREGDEAAGHALLDDARRLLRRRNVTAAARRLEDALTLCPTGPVALAAHLTLARAAERQGLADLAYSQYHLALAQNPSPALAARMYRSMISTSTRNGKVDLAVEHAEKLCALPAGEVAPADRVVHRWILARLYADKGQSARAAKLLRAVVAEHDGEHTQIARLELSHLAEKMMDLEGPR